MAERCARATTAHRQTTASNGVEVDEGIVELLEAVWALGMSTEFSCQGDHDKLAHICFAEAADAHRFTGVPGDFLVTLGERRAWVDFPAHQIRDLTDHWQAVRDGRSAAGSAERRLVRALQ